MANFNIAPYFDDYDPAKHFYRVLFKPGFAVQARELNQLQSILQNQITSIGNHLFKKNSIVIPGSVSLKTAVDIVYVDLGDPSTIVGKTITNAVNFDYTDDSTLDGSITAVVIAATAKTTDKPAALYVKYYKTGLVNGERVTKFGLTDTLSTVEITPTTFNVDSTLGTSVGKAATISRGVFYTHETFVECDQQSVIIETDGTITNCSIGLNIVTSIVSADEDPSLLDNALGSPNQYAPGADRYKIDLRLVRVDPTTAVDDDNFILLMKVENNVVTYLNNNTQYAEIMKMIARRTYDANGNFVVSGLTASVTKSSDDNYLWANVAAGRCYLGGYEYNQLTNVPVAIAKPRTTEYQEVVGPTSIYTNEMAYFLAAGGSYLKEIPVENSLVRFINAAPGTPSASTIGYGIFKGIQYLVGDNANGTDVYKAFFESISLEKGYSYEDIGGFLSTTAVEGVAEGTALLHRIALTNISGNLNVNDNIESSYGLAESGLLYYILNQNAFLVKNTLNKSPSDGLVKVTSTGVTASIVSKFVTNYTSNFIPMIEVSPTTYKTLYVNNANNTEYSVVTKVDIPIPAGSGIYTYTSPALGGDDTYDNLSVDNYFAFVTTSGSEDVINLLDKLEIGSNGKTISIDFPEDLRETSVSVYSTVIKSKATQSTKTLLTEDVIINQPSASWMALGHQDVTNIVKIVDSGSLAIASASWSSNVLTVTAVEDHGLSSGDSVLIKGVQSSVSFDGVYTVLSSGLTNTAFQVTLGSDPGITGVTGAIAAPPPNINSDTDVTSRYYLDTGNTPYLRGTGLIKLKRGAIRPQGQLAVRYQRYQIQTGGNYISVDSYGNYAAPSLSYIGNIKNIETIETRRYLDFRTTTSNYFFKNIGSTTSGTNTITLKDLNLSIFTTSLVGKYVIGPGYLNGTTITDVEINHTTGDTILTLATNASLTGTSTYYIGLNGSSFSLVDTSLAAGGVAYSYPKDTARLSYSYVKFLPRQLMLYLSREGDAISIKYEDVNNLAEVEQYRRNEFRLPLIYLYMKPYTTNVTEVEVTNFENPVYKMLDIHDIKRQVDRIEYYASLSLEDRVREVIEDDRIEGTTSISEGFWNENFRNPLLQDFGSSDFAATIYDKTYVAPGTITRTIPLVADTATNNSLWAQTGTSFTLPYTEIRAFGNDKASVSNNLNPFNAINWQGKLTLNPSVDNWVDTTFDTGLISETTTQTAIPTQTFAPITNNVNVTVVIPPPVSIVPPTPAQPPVVVPQPPIEEIVIDVSGVRTLWGPDSFGGNHAITFDWATNLGRIGRVNTDSHLSQAMRTFRGSISGNNQESRNASVITTLLNKKYTEVSDILNAGQHFDQDPPSVWQQRRNG